VLRLAGGLNRFGEPNYRAVWGWSRLDWVGGKWEDRDEHGVLVREIIQLRQVPKYTPFNRWHIERWMPPESYGSPRTWHAQTVEYADGQFVPALGPYPSRGDYEHSYTLQTSGGEFIQLTTEVARFIAAAIEFSRHIPSVKKRAAIRASVERQEREYDSFADSVLNDSGAAFSGVPHVAVL